MTFSRPSEPVSSAAGPEYVAEKSTAALPVNFDALRGVSRRLRRQGCKPVFSVQNLKASGFATETLAEILKEVSG